VERGPSRSSLQDLLAVLEELHAKGVGLYLHRQGVDTTTPAGRALFQMLRVFAEFERAMIVERVNAGLARARDKGTRSGRPIGRPRVEISKEHRIRELRRKGVALLKIAREVGCGTSVVQRVLAGAR
jgi:DNA invertase Pin-like site-specific DNA recombinase